MARIKVDLDNTGKLSVTKIDAAVRQLEAAIRLWFEDGDPVVICTLTYSGYEIIHAINKGAPMVPDMFVYAKDEKHETELKVIFRLDSNFLKHAAKDPNEVHHLATRVYPLVLLDAINTYVRLGFPARPLFTAFMLWMGLNYPQFLAEPLSESFRQLRSIQQAGAFSKKDLLDAALKLVTQQTAAGV